MYILSVLVLGTTLLFATGSGLAQEPDSSETPPVRGSAETADAAADSAPEIVAPAAPPVEPIESISEAINKAGRQRMLTQRIVKCYAQIGQDIRYLSASTQLQEALELFERQLQQLRAFAQDPEAQQLLTLVEERWQPMKQIATEEVTRTRVGTLRALAEQVLAAAHQVVLLLEARSGSNQGHLVNLAGRQRMLTQRMAALYLLLNWGLDDPQHLADYEKAVQEFDAALYELNTAGENTPQITEALQRVSSNWQVFKLGNRVDQGEYVPSLVTRVLDKILLQMNEITGMYADLQIP